MQGPLRRTEFWVTVTVWWLRQATRPPLQGEAIWHGTLLPPLFCASLPVSLAFGVVGLGPVLDHNTGQRAVIKTSLPCLLRGLRRQA